MPPPRVMPSSKRHVGLGVGIQQVVERIFRREEFLVQGAGIFETSVQRANVPAGAECFLAGTPDQDGEDLRIGRIFVEQCAQPQDHLERQRVQRSGTIQRDERHVIANFA